MLVFMFELPHVQTLNVEVRSKVKPSTAVHLRGVIKYEWQ